METRKEMAFCGIVVSNSDALTICNVQSDVKLNYLEILFHQRGRILLRGLLTCLYIFIGPVAFPQIDPLISVEIPPSPTAVTLTKYGDFPVDLSTGLPTISIPLFNITSRSISIPIALSYHASGVKVNDLAAWTGLGWTLQAGGVVSRNLQGLPDEDSQDGFLKYASTVPDREDIYEGDPNDKNMLEHLANGDYEMEPDLFSFNAPGVSGKFVYGNDRGIYIYPKQAVRISPGIENGDDYYEIINVDGTIYRFGKSFNGADTRESTQAYVKGPDPPLYVSSWFLSEIVSADYQDTVHFEYETHNYLEYGVNESQSLTVKYNGQSFQPFLGNVSFDQLTVPKARKLKRIIYSGGKVEFTTGTRSDNLTDRKLNRVDMYMVDPLTGAFTLSRSFEFHYSYMSDQGYYRLRLDSLTESAVSISKPPYIFEYNVVNLPPKNSYAQDHWGYFNGKISNSNLIPRLKVKDQIVGYADRSSDLSYSLAGSLTAIKYPTGGRTDFSFELNTYDSMGTELTSGGLRIKQIISTDHVAEITSKKTYEYNNSGKLQFGPPIYIHEVEMRQYGIVGSLGCLFQQSWNYATISRSPIFNRWNVSAPVHYTYVSEYFGDTNTNAGKTDHRFTYDPDGGVTAFPFPPLTDNGYKRGNPKATVHYANVGSNDYDSVQFTLNDFTHWTETFESVKGLKVGRAIISSGGECWPDPLEDRNEFAKENFYTQSVFRYLKETSTTTYDQNDTDTGVTTHTQYFYDNIQHLMPTRQRTFLEIDTIDKLTIYPQDLNSPHPIYTQMISRNMISHPIEQQTFRNSKLISSNATQYQLSGISFVPYRVFYAAIGTPLSSFQTTTDGIMFDPVYEEKAIVNAYSSYARIVEITGTDGIPKSYLWNNKLSIPIASAESANSGDIAYTSFEGSMHEGNLFFTGNVLTEAGKTGNKVFNGTITTTGLQASKTYEVRFWAKNGTPTINGITPTIHESDQDGWTLYVAPISGSTTISVNASVTGIRLDEVRICPERSMMTTYCYNQNGLLLARTDPNGIINYFEYDEFNRLVLIRDHENNILQTYKYHYAGQ